jgi:intein/homing endonuclease
VTVATMLTDLLAAAVDALNDPPARQFVAHGAFAWDCVAEGTMVHTERGPIPIEEVVVGDRVWSWDDGYLRLHDVTATADKGERETIAIGSGRRTIRVTPEHRVLVNRLIGRPGHKQNVWEAQWVAARDVRRDDLLVVMDKLPDAPTLSTRWLPDGTVIDEDVAWLIGLFLADGSVTFSGVQFCVYGELRARVEDIVLNVWGLTGTESQRDGLVLFSQSLRRCFQELGLHERSAERLVPTMLLDSDPKLIRAMLTGYADGDGYRRTETKIAYAAANEKLLRQIRALHMGIGDVVTNMSVEQRTRPIIIKGKQVVNALPLHRFVAWTEQKRRGNYELGYRGARRSLPDERLIVDKVRTIKDGGRRRVYDLTVEGAHSFLADSVVVHNCELVAVSGGTFSFGPSKQACAVMPSVTLDLTVVRCYPTAELEGDGDVTLPTVDALTAASGVLLDDLWQLAMGISAAWQAGTLFATDKVHCSEVTLGNVRPIGPGGGFAGWAMSVTVNI